MKTTNVELQITSIVDQTAQVEEAYEKNQWQTDGKIYQRQQQLYLWYVEPHEEGDHTVQIKVTGEDNVMIKRRVTGVNYVLNFNRQKATLNYHPITEKQAIELVGFLDDLEVYADEVKFTYRLYQADNMLGVYTHRLNFASKK